MASLHDVRNESDLVQVSSLTTQLPSQCGEEVEPDYTAFMDDVCREMGLPFLLRREQNEAVTSVMNCHDTMVILGTGQGKTIVYAVLPKLLQTLNRNSMILVISPLKALICDQATRMNSMGLRVLEVADEESLDARLVNSSNYDVLLLCPESLDRCRPLLKSVKSQFGAVVVDEAHCTSTWKDYRSEYGELGRIRAIVTAPLLALTASAPPAMQTEIQESLHMKNTRTVTACLDRKNIFYAVYKVDRSFHCFDWLLEKLIEDPKNCPRAIIYCRSRDDISALYNYCIEKVGDDVNFTGNRQTHRECRIIMFHQSVTERMKNHITRSFPKESSTYRIIIASCALGMGLDSKRVKYVFHHDPPKDFTSYYQESGRCGRDPTMAAAAILYYTRATATDSAMKEYCQNTTNACLRYRLSSHFQPDVEVPPSGHNCCLVCHSRCDCGDCPVIEGDYREQQPSQSMEIVTIDVSKSDRDAVRAKLSQLRARLQTQYRHMCFSPLFASGFTEECIKTICRSLENIVDYDDLYNIYVFDEAIAREVYELIYSVTGRLLNEF